MPCKEKILFGKVWSDQKIAKKMKKIQKNFQKTIAHFWFILYNINTEGWNRTNGWPILKKK